MDRPSGKMFLVIFGMFFIVFYSEAQFGPYGDEHGYNISTQAECHEVSSEPPLRDYRWVAGLFNNVDQEVKQGTIIAYKIQWFNGRWSGWYIPGVNDFDTKVNLKDRTFRRRWAYFYDHNHMYIICKRNSQYNQQAATFSTTTSTIDNDDQSTTPPLPDEVLKNCPMVTSDDIESMFLLWSLVPMIIIILLILLQFAYICLQNSAEKKQEVGQYTDIAPPNSHDASVFSVYDTVKSPDDSNDKIHN